MAYDLVRFERGQVWFISKGTNTVVGHEQDKSRPWLVVSTRKFNHSSKMITAVPITSRDHTVSPVQVKYTNLEGKPNVVMCEQIRTFDVSGENRKFDYVGTVSEAMMSKVDEALAFHLGLKYNPVSLEILFDSIDTFVSKIMKLRSADFVSKFTDDDVLAFVDKLQTATNLALENAAKNSEVAAKNSETAVSKHIDAVSSKPAASNPTTLKPHKLPLAPTVDVLPPAPAKKSKTARLKWTPELAANFISDADTLPMREVMDKWGILKKPRFYSMKKYAEDLLKKTSVQSQP